MLKAALKGLSERGLCLCEVIRKRVGFCRPEVGYVLAPDTLGRTYLEVWK